MNNMWILLTTSFKQTFRNKENIFWSLVFPILFILIFRFFNFSATVTSHVIVIDNAQNEISAMLIEALASVDGMGINREYTNLEEAKKQLEGQQQIEFNFIDADKEESASHKAQVNVVMVIPEQYGLNGAVGGSQIKLYYNDADEGQASPSAIVESIITSITNEITLQRAGVVNEFAIERTGINVNEITYYDVLIPGLIGMGVMQSGIIGMAATIAAFKEKRILKRLSATPLPAWKFIVAQVIIFLVLTVIQVALMLGIGALLGANYYGNLILVFVLALVANFTFLNLGFIAAALTKSASAASSFAQIFTTPMMFLSGVFFAREMLPEPLQTIANLLPLSPLLDALRSVMLLDAALTDVGYEIGLILIWTVITLIFAIKLFKFREE